MAATLTRGQQDHLVVPSSSPGPLQQQRYRVTPAVTRSRAQPPGVSRAFTLLAAEEDIARTLAQSDASFSTWRSSQRAPHTCWRYRRCINKRTLGRRPHLGKGGALGGGGAFGGRDLRGGRGNVAKGEFRVVHVQSDLQHTNSLTKPLHRETFCVHRNFVMNIS